MVRDEKKKGGRFGLWAGVTLCAARLHSAMGWQRHPIAFLTALSLVQAALPAATGFALAPALPVSARTRPSVFRRARLRGARRACSRSVAPPEEAEGSAPSALVAFPGGGIFFWWQAGFVQALQQRREGSVLGTISMVGASAGALAAVLAACDVSMAQAFESAYRICERRNVWTQPLGLFGCWGAIVEEWLCALLPDNAHELCSGRVFILVTTVNQKVCVLCVLCACVCVCMCVCVCKR